MSTRKIFLSSALGASALYAGARAQADPAPAVSPTPQSSATTKPTALAQELAASLQRQLKKAKLSDAMTHEIAKAIQDDFAISNAFANKDTTGLPSPDFVFVATSDDRP